MWQERAKIGWDWAMGTMLGIRVEGTDIAEIAPPATAMKNTVLRHALWFPTPNPKPDPAVASRS